MNRLLSALVVLSATTALAETTRSEGEGWVLEARSPGVPLIKISGPKGANVYFYNSSRQADHHAALDSCTIPCELAPRDGDAWKRVVFKVILGSGGLWAQGGFEPQHRTEYRLTVQDPSELQNTETASAPPAPAPKPTPAPVAPAPASAPVTQVPAPAPVAQPAPVKKRSAMDESRFERLLGAIEEEHGSTARMTVLKAGASGASLSVAQVAALLPLFSMSDHKVEVVKLVAANLVDPQNGFELLKHFSMTVHKQKVKALLPSAPAGGEETAEDDSF
jgi:hypothetical protein